MKQTISIVFDNKEELDEFVIDSLTETLGADLNAEIYETDTTSVIELELDALINEDQSDPTANNIAESLFDLGYNNFDIEISV